MAGFPSLKWVKMHLMRSLKRHRRAVQAVTCVRKSTSSALLTTSLRQILTITKFKWTNRLATSRTYPKPTRTNSRKTTNVMALQAIKPTRVPSGKRMHLRNLSRIADGVSCDLHRINSLQRLCREVTLTIMRARKPTMEVRMHSSRNFRR